MEVEQTSEFERQIESLLAKEREARLNNKNDELANVVKQIVQLAFDMKEYTRLFELMVEISKRRGQSKKAQTQMVHLAISFIDLLEDISIRIKLIETIKEICDKKIFLEVEYARCCLRLVKYKENDNEINEAAKILQEVQVETYGSMDKREKVEFILYQMKIMVKKGDFVRLMIISKKLTPQALNDKKIIDLKIQYYAYLVEYFKNENLFVEVANCYKQIFDAQNNKENSDIELPITLDFNFDASFQTTFENLVAYLLIPQYSPKQQEELTALVGPDYKHILSRYPRLKNVVESFLKDELIDTNPTSYQLQDILCFKDQVKGIQNTSEFRKQLIQHNIRVICKYYSRINLTRISELLKISTEEAENELCEMQNEKLVYCKIDKLKGIANFRPRSSENDILNSWANDVNKVLVLIDQTTNLIKREEEQYIAAK